MMLTRQQPNQLIAAVVGLTLLALLYAALYLVTVKTSGIVILHGQSGTIVHDYRIAGKVCRKAFFPIHWLDRRFRPNKWTIRRAPERPAWTMESRR